MPSHGPLRAILFDLDDTVHDKSATLLKVARSLHEAARLENIGIQAEEWEASFVALNNARMEKTEVFSQLAERFGIAGMLRDRLLRDFDANLGAHAVAFPGALELVDRCRQRGWKTGIVTNGRDAFQRSKIAGMGLAPRIDAIVTSGAFGGKKPDPAIFLHGLALLGVEPREALFVGDDFQADIEPSVKLGMRAIWKSKDASSLAWHCTDSLLALRTFLADLP